MLFLWLTHKVSEIFCVFLHTNHAFVTWMKYLMPLYWVQYKYVTINFTNFTRTPHRLKCIGNILCVSVNKHLVPYIYYFQYSVHSTSNMNSKYKFKNIWRIFTTVRACIDGPTDRQTNRMHKHFSFLLENVKNHITQLKIYF